MRRVGVLVGAALLVAVPLAASIPTPARAAPAAASAAAGPVIEILTVPALPDVTFVIDGARHTSDSRGMLRVSLDPKARGHTLSIADKDFQREAGDYTFNRWWYQGRHDQDFRSEIRGIEVQRHLRIIAAFRASYVVRYSFVDEAKMPVPRERVTRVEFRGDHGQTVTGNGSGKVRMVGVRPTISGGTLVAKEVRYGVQRVDVDGSNVVQVNQQVFIPAQKPAVAVPLLLRTAHFTTRDLLFGHPVGSALQLSYPDGQVTTVPLQENGRVTIEGLARGHYSVRVVAPGYSFDRPLVLSKNQYVDLPVLTYLDLAVLGSIGLAVVVCLYLLRLRTGLAHWRRQHPTT